MTEHIRDLYRTDPDLVDAIAELVDAHEPTRGDHTNGDPTPARAPDTIADPPMESETTPMESDLLAIEDAGWTWRLSHTSARPELVGLRPEPPREWTLHVERSSMTEGSWRRFTGADLTVLLAEALAYVERDGGRA